MPPQPQGRGGSLSIPYAPARWNEQLVLICRPRLAKQTVGTSPGGPATARERSWSQPERIEALLPRSPEEEPGGSASATSRLGGNAKPSAGADFFFCDNFQAVFGGEETLSIFAPRFAPVKQPGPVAQLDRASHYGCEGLGFESLQGHKEACKSLTCRLFL